MSLYQFDTVRDEYRDLWSRMEVLKVVEANLQARRITAAEAKSRYKIVETRTGVPWFVVGCLHMRESSANFKTWLHNGDRMKDGNGNAIKTVHIPPNRPPNPNVSWEEGAYDALVVCEHLDEIKNWGPEHVAYAAEKFNGFGYRNPSRAIPSPYLWGGTSVQKPGKFIRDGVYDATVMDPQVGAMAVLKQIMALDPDAVFKTASPSVVPPHPDDSDQPQSPKADDTESEVKPIAKSKSIWGGITGWLTSVSSAFFGLFDKLDNPYVFSAFIIILIIASVAAYLVIKGRIDVQKIVMHLSEDDKVPSDKATDV